VTSPDYRYADTFIVICMENQQYTLATRQVFSTVGDAIAYAATINLARNPLVIPGRWHQLRYGVPMTYDQAKEALAAADGAAPVSVNIVNGLVKEIEYLRGYTRTLQERIQRLEPKQPYPDDHVEWEKP
jgi:hypothetical protein